MAKVKAGQSDPDEEFCRAVVRLRPGRGSIRTAEGLLRSPILREWRSSGKRGQQEAAYYESILHQKLSNYQALAGNFARALQLLTRSAALLPQMTPEDRLERAAMIHFDRALTRFLSGKRDQGLKEMRQAPTNQRWPSPVLVQVTCARMMLELGQMKAGLALLEKAIKNARQVSFTGKDLLSDILAVATTGGTAIPPNYCLSANDLVHYSRKGRS